MKIEALNFSVRTYNILKRAQIDTVEQLQKLSCDELMRIRNLGRHSLEEIHEKLEQLTMTNADHIRSMSDEGLARWLDAIVVNCHKDCCSGCPLEKSCWGDCTLDWLKQPKEKEE